MREMLGKRFLAPFRDRRGVALPMALLSLLILTTLILAFSVLSATEPTIASNQLLVAQARAAAEAGLERAAWALSHPAAANVGIPDPLPAPVPAPYDGSQLMSVAVGGAALGGFRVVVAPGGGPTERNVTSTGFAPNDTAPGRGRQRITATLVKLRFPDPPAALAVRGILDISGTVDIDSRQDTSCGNKAGTWSTQTTDVQGAGDVWGADGNDLENQASDVIQNVPENVFDQYILSDAELDALKVYAKAMGTYYQGAVTFNSGNKMPNGLIFVDTYSGQNITPTGVTPATPDSDMADVEIHGNASLDPDGFKGWIVVNGSLLISGQFRADGLIYVQNDLTYSGIGDSQVTGAVITRNIRDTSYTSIDGDLGGNAIVVYDCAKARTGAGFIPENWMIKTGTYREVSG
jgi:hypothetical protein